MFSLLHLLLFLNERAFSQHYECGTNAKFSGIHCSPAVCMEMWIEQMPKSWLATANFFKSPTYLKSPQWSPLESVTCSRSENDYNCSCVLPTFTSKLMYADYHSSFTRLYGDSTLRNFNTFIGRYAEAMTYDTFSENVAFHKQLSNSIESNLVLNQRGSLPSNFVQGNVEFTKFKYEIPKSWPKKINCLNASALFMSYSGNTYEHLSIDYDYPHEASTICRDYPGRVIIYIISAGLHYLTVSDIILGVTQLY
jgi:hypothetical protein